ncbi:hypothetical protein PENTCL1PPCAC_7556, partial [Pristionchus entomophagus]
GAECDRANPDEREEDEEGTTPVLLEETHSDGEKNDQFVQSDAEEEREERLGGGLHAEGECLDGNVNGDGEKESERRDVLLEYLFVNFENQSF